MLVVFRFPIRQTVLVAFTVNLNHENSFLLATVPARIQTSRFTWLTRTTPSLMHQPDRDTLFLSPTFNILSFCSHTSSVSVTTRQQLQVVDHHETRISTPPCSRLIHSRRHVIQPQRLINDSDTRKFVSSRLLQVS